MIGVLSANFGEITERSVWGVIARSGNPGMLLSAGVVVAPFVVRSVVVVQVAPASRGPMRASTSEQRSARAGTAAASDTSSVTTEGRSMMDSGGSVELLVYKGRCSPHKASTSFVGPLSDNARMTDARMLAARLADLLRRERAELAEFLLLLADFDKQRGWLELGYSRLFYFLHRELGLFKGAAYYRKTAAEPVQRSPRSSNRCATAGCASPASSTRPGSSPP